MDRSSTISLFKLVFLLGNIILAIIIVYYSYFIAGEYVIQKIKFRYTTMIDLLTFDSSLSIYLCRIIEIEQILKLIYTIERRSFLLYSIIPKNVISKNC